jgi:hypothetical protein
MQQLVARVLTEPQRAKAAEALPPVEEAVAAAA